jgi:folate-binding protein YgfZ
MTPTSTNKIQSFDRTSERACLVFTGPDRVKCLQNLTTADVKRLTPGAGCEAFVTSTQGKTLAFVTLHIPPEGENVLLRTDLEARDRLLNHIQKYTIFDDVAFSDLTSEVSEVYLAGESILEHAASLGWGVPPTELGVADLRLGASGSIQIIPECPTGGMGLCLLGDQALVEHARRTLEDLVGAILPGSAEEFEGLRVAAGWPKNGAEVTPDHLPQEIGRDARAISFTKGCYLGQETVARLDALGHVNRILRGLQFDAPPPPVGAGLSTEGKDVGFITSTAEHPNLGFIGLGFARTPQVRPGSVVELQNTSGLAGQARVVDLPITNG